MINVHRQAVLRTSCTFTGKVRLLDVTISSFLAGLFEHLEFRVDPHEHVVVKTMKSVTELESQEFLFVFSYCMTTVISNHRNNRN